MTTTRINHTGHNHPSTTAARTACRNAAAAACSNCGGPASGWGCNPDKGCENVRGGLPLDGPAPTGARKNVLALVATARAAGMNPALIAGCRFNG